MWVLSFAVFALLTLQASLNPRETQKPKGNLEGTVVRAGSGQPISGARVTLIPGVAFEDSGPNSRRQEIAPVLTDSQGRFVFQVEEGAYMVRAQANGYVPQAYGQRIPDGPGTPVLLGSGQTTRNINISLTPAANISGRIRDEAGRPLASVPVQLLSYSYDDRGEPSYRTGVVGAVQTNDRGEYRMYWVTPGRYYVLAGRSTTGSNPMRDIMAVVLGGANAAGSKVSPVAGHAFYPGVADISNARAVDLQPGADLQAVDVTLTAKPRTYSVRGKLVDAGTGQAPAEANVLLLPQTPGLSMEGIEAAMGMSNRNYDGATGKFEIRGLLPGPYVVIAIAEDPLAATRRGLPIRPSGMLAVSVSDTDVDNVVVSVAPPVSITGRLRIEGQLPPSVTMDQMNVFLHPTGANRAAQRTTQNATRRVFQFLRGVATQGRWNFSSRQHSSRRIQARGGGSSERCRVCPRGSVRWRRYSEQPSAVFRFEPGRNGHRFRCRRREAWRVCDGRSFSTDLRRSRGNHSGSCAFPDRSLSHRDHRPERTVCRQRYCAR
jgi:hypothetical protein